MSRPPIHPGEILAGELKEVGVSPTGLARLVDVPPNRISEIIRGRRAITGDTALRLGHWFGASPQFWLNLQTAYDLRVASDQAGDAIEKLPRREARAADTRVDAQLGQIGREPPVVRPVMAALARSHGERSHSRSMGRRD